MKTKIRKSMETPKLNLKLLFSLYLIQTTFTLLLTAIPVLVKTPSGLFGINDFIRLIEPIIALPLQYAILHQSNPSIKTISIFLVFASIYQQGSGYHSSFTLAKNLLRFIYPAYIESTDLLALHSLYRDLWEHILSHYIYAFGYLIMSCIYIIQYRNTSQELNKIEKVIFCAAVVILGLLVGAVSIDFTGGSYVGLCITISSVIILTVYLVVKDGVKSLVDGFKRPVLRYYLYSMLIGLFIITVWIIRYGFKDRAEVLG